MKPLRIFLAQGIYVLLLGLQTINVADRNYAGAVGVSLALGMLGFWLTAIIAELKTDGVYSFSWWAFIIAGPIGIALSIWLYSL